MPRQAAIRLEGERQLRRGPRRSWGSTRRREARDGSRRERPSSWPVRGRRRGALPGPVPLPTLSSHWRRRCVRLPPSGRSSSADSSAPRPDSITVRHRPRHRRAAAPVQGRGVSLAPDAASQSGFPPTPRGDRTLSTSRAGRCGRSGPRQDSPAGRLARAGRPMLRRTTSMTSSVYASASPVFTAVRRQPAT